MNSNDKKPPTSVSAVPGMAVFGCFAVGILGIIAAIIQLLHSVQPGLSLVAAAVAFGIIVHVSFRSE